ncbi:glycosyltransferase family 2 protein [Polynucleobacter sphagniphilus]|jgi:GT2 family glycosyltransferase|uniref:glycosyltransferase family 2 protein n=1 Tax=Polynucleobacter sphagniphilus TaxID=1743169 RepID=UPI0024758912|nr:glycosyltransferase family 2 protein [Polynucleobacter sphagniphilus]
MEYILAVSLVIYKTPIHQVKAVIDSLLSEAEVQLSIHIFDNGNSLDLKNYALTSGYNYHSLGYNIGFGRGHNFIFNSLDRNVQYILFINPDVFLKGTDLYRVLNLFSSNGSCGLLSPKLVYEDGSLQDICRILPDPFQLIKRRFSKKSSELGNINLSKLANLNGLVDVPFIHGACIFVKSKVFEDVGGFDPRYFLYMEDLDLCRKIQANYRVCYSSEVSAIHQHEKGSYKSIKLLLIHLISAFRYFNKWGWIFDNKRDVINTHFINVLKNN